MIEDESGFAIEWLSPEDKGSHAVIHIAMLSSMGARTVSLPIEYAAIDRLVIELLALREKGESQNDKRK